MSNFCLAAHDRTSKKRPRVHKHFTTRSVRRVVGGRRMDSTGSELLLGSGRSKGGTRAARTRNSRSCCASATEKLLCRTGCVKQNETGPGRGRGVGRLSEFGHAASSLAPNEVSKMSHLASASDSSSAEVCNYWLPAVVFLALLLFKPGRGRQWCSPSSWPKVGPEAPGCPCGMMLKQLHTTARHERTYASTWVGGCSGELRGSGRASGVTPGWPLNEILGENDGLAGCTFRGRYGRPSLVQGRVSGPKSGVAGARLSRDMVWADGRGAGQTRGRIV